MIRTAQEYQLALERISEDDAMIVRTREELTEEGYTPEEVQRGLDPLITFRNQLADEAAWYQEVASGRVPTVNDFANTGRLLIALRVQNGWTQQQLADRLGVSRAQVTRDKLNEYHGITIERAKRVFDAFKVEVQTHFQPVEAQGAHPAQQLPVTMSSRKPATAVR
jgi:hypothetical protein